MKIAIPSQENSLSSKVDSKSGKANYFVVYDTESGDYQIIKNPKVKDSHRCVGMISTDILLECGIDACLFKNCGPNVFKILRAKGVKIYTGVPDIVSECIEAFKRGELKEAKEPNVTW